VSNINKRLKLQRWKQTSPDHLSWNFRLRCHDCLKKLWTRNYGPSFSSSSAVRQLSPPIQAVSNQNIFRKFNVSIFNIFIAEYSYSYNHICIRINKTINSLIIIKAYNNLQLIIAKKFDYAIFTWHNQTFFEIGVTYL